MDGEMPNVFEHKLVKARKQHICYECGITISVGDTYAKSKGYWPDSGWQTFKVCEECEDIRHQLRDREDGYAPFGELREWAREADISLPKAS